MPALLEHANYTVSDPEATAAWMEKLFGWNIENKSDNFNFYCIFEEYNEMKGSFEEFGLKEFDEYLQAE